MNGRIQKRRRENIICKRENMDVKNRNMLQVVLRIVRSIVWIKEMKVIKNIQMLR